MLFQRVTRRLNLAVPATVLFFFSPISQADTVFCKYLNVGCLTELEKQKVKDECRKETFQKSTYTKYLRKAYEYHDRKNFIGLTTWEAQGFESAHAYAIGYLRTEYHACLDVNGVKD
jgi:hypothetical protein